jgi:sigma-B regulation protein RsbU (phosphoserine phosphatase)
MCSFTPADILLLYTDGLSDTRRNEEFFDEERVCDALVCKRHLPAAALVATLLAEVETFAGLNTLRDDTALLAVRGQDAG